MPSPNIWSPMQSFPLVPELPTLPLPQYLPYMDNSPPFLSQFRLLEVWIYNHDFIYLSFYLKNLYFAFSMPKKMPKATYMDRLV